MPTVLQNILPAIDSARAQLTTIGLRLYRVFVRVRTWSGAGLGQGNFTDVDTELLPRPRVKEQMRDGGDRPLDLVISQAGEHLEGGLTIDRISASIALATLDPPVNANQKLYYFLQPATAASSPGRSTSSMARPSGRRRNGSSSWRRWRPDAGVRAYFDIKDQDRGWKGIVRGVPKALGHGTRT
jgi:hypothetical protein